MTAYLIAQLMDVRLFRHLYRQGHTWAPSFVQKQQFDDDLTLVDTVVVKSIFLSFGPGLPWDIVAKIIVAAYVFKLVFAAIDTPFIYLGVALLGRYIGADAVEKTAEEVL